MIAKRRLIDARTTADIRCRSVRLIAFFAALYFAARLVLFLLDKWS